MEDNSFQVFPIGSEEKDLKIGKYVFWLLISAVVVIAILFVWFFFISPGSFSDQGMSLSIEAPKEISSGDAVEYRVRYHNLNQQSLKEVRLVFSYPSGAVVIKDGQVKSSPTEEVSIGRLKAGQGGEVKFPVFLVGDKGTLKKAIARLIYSPDRVQSTFEKEAEAVTNITGLSVALTLVAPPNAVSGQVITYFLDYRNESSDNLGNLRAKFSYPDGFSFQQADPVPSSDQDNWEIKNIPSGQGQRLSISGILRGTEQENKAIAVVLQRKVGEIWVDYERASSSTIITTPPLAVKVTVNDSPNYTASLGGDLNYQIKFNNNSAVNLLSLTISVKFDGSMFDFSNLKSNGFFESSTRTITWNAASSPLLNNLAPQQEGAVSFSLPLKSSFPTNGLGAKDFIVKVSVKAETPTVPPGFYFDHLIAQAELATKIKSLPSFEQAAFAVYKKNDLTTSGPFPPKVGQKTVYVVHWLLANAANNILRTRARAVLPIGVNWENKTEVSGAQPQPTFNSSSREIVWDIGTLPAGTGSAFPKYETWFEISAIPSSQQASSALKLLSGVALGGEDSSTGQNFVLHLVDIDSNTLADFPYQGAVVQ